MKEAALSIRNVSFSYGSKPVLEQVCAELAEKKLSVLLGSNGSGKSTLFNILAGLQSGFQGEICLFGQPTRHLRFRDRASLIGFLPQFHRTAFPFTVEEILLTGRTAFAGLRPHQKDRTQLDRVLSELAIPFLRNTPFNQLSGGEQQLVMIGRLLMQSPRLLLLDEPTNHLDVWHRHDLMRRLKHYTENGLTVVTIMHDPTLACQYADHFYYLHHGRIITTENNTAPDLSLLSTIYAAEFVSYDYNGRPLIIPTGPHTKIHQS